MRYHFIAVEKATFGKSEDHACPACTGMACGQESCCPTHASSGTALDREASLQGDDEFAASVSRGTESPAAQLHSASPDQFEQQLSTIAA